MRKIIFIFLLLMVSSYASSEVYYFYKDGCPACAAIEPKLDELAAKYSASVREFDVYENSSLLLALSAAHGLDTSLLHTPTVFVNDNVFIGYSEIILAQMEAELAACQSKDCPTVESVLANNGTEKEIDFGLVTVTALADAVNPCEWAVLTLMLITITKAGNRRKTLKAGLAFSAAIYLAYLMMGLGLITAIKASGISAILFSIIGIFAVVIGLLNIKDAVKLGAGGFMMQIPQRWKPRVQKVIGETTSIRGAFFVGFIVSLFLTPCTSGPYIFILSLLAVKATYVSGLLWLIYYNLIFIAPMIAITLLVYYGITSPEKAQAWRKSRVRYMHLAAGVIMLVMGLYVLLFGL